MILAIKQYLSTLKESKELDAILPDLLSVMGIKTISKPLIGTRQNGVDIAAVGKGSNDKEDKLFLFVIKCGDLGRKDWNSGEQSIRQSLDDIEDTYLLNNIPIQYKNLKCKIVLVTGGNLLQNIDEQWIGYTKQHESENKTYELWDGDILSSYFHEYLFNENILLPEYRSLFRRTLVKIEDPSYNLEDFYKLFNLLIKDIPIKNSRKNQNLLFTSKMCLKILIKWSKEIGNYKHAINAAEYAVLSSWNHIQEKDLYKEKSIIIAWKELYNELFEIVIQNTNKFSNLYCISNGLNGYTKSQNSEIESLRVFEQLGFLAETGLLIFLEFARTRNQYLYENFINTSNLIEELYNNHYCLLNPLYDSHVIEINMSLYVLFLNNKKEYISNLLSNMIEHITYAYVRMEKYFPVYSDDFHDLINENHDNKENLFQISTLLFWLLEWACVLKDENLYKQIYQHIKNDCPNTFVEQWYPTTDSEKKIYISNAGFGTGITYVCMPIPKTIKEMTELIMQQRDKEIELKDFSCFNNGFPDLLFLSSRHFRTPIIPEFLKSILQVENETDVTNNM